MTYTTITFGGLTITATSVIPTRKQATLKYKVGKSLNEFSTPTRDAFDWEIRITGLIADSTISTTRASLEALNDVTLHAYSDGQISINAIMRPESLRFTDSGDDAGMVYRYDFTIIQYNQS